jgi:hypothetical protein
MSVWLHSKINPKVKGIFRRLFGIKIRGFVRRILSALLGFPYFFASKGIFLTQNHRKILSLHNKHVGERCFIIGSGPSINDMDLTPLKKEITFGFNAFYLIKDRVGFLPTYYLVEDPFPAEDNAGAINQLHETIKIFPSDLKYCLRPDNHTIYVYFNRDYVEYHHPDFPLFSDNALRCIYWGGTVAYMALQMAYYMGIREVYLLGIDLTYNIPSHLADGVVISNEADTSHFHPDYFGPGKRWHDPKVERMSKSFEKAGEFFIDKGGKVYNATVGGKLEIIPRVDFNSLF